MPIPLGGAGDALHSPSRGDHNPVEAFACLHPSNSRPHSSMSLPKPLKCEGRGHAPLAGLLTAAPQVSSSAIAVPGRYATNAHLRPAIDTCAQTSLLSVHTDGLLPHPYIPSGARRPGCAAAADAPRQSSAAPRSTARSTGSTCASTCGTHLQATATSVCARSRTRTRPSSSCCTRSMSRRAS
jgi:hypothetical protein